MILLQTIPHAYRIWFYAVLAIIATYVLLVFIWQVQVLRGRSMQNPDGSFDDWHIQDTHFGIAVADIFIACPLSIISLVLVLANSIWGIYLLSMAGFWLLWANTMTTATSLRFHQPRMGLQWFVTFPFGAIVGLAVLGWLAVVVAYLDVSTI